MCRTGGCTHSRPVTGERYDDLVDDTGSEETTATSALPQGSVVPGADIWDDDDDDLTGDDAGSTHVIDLESERRDLDARSADEEWDDDSWLTEAQVVAHVDDDGVHDGSRGVEADDDDTTEAFGTKMQRWGTSSMLGASLSGLGLGLQQVLRPKETTQIEIRVEDDTDDDLDPIEVRLGDVPEDSVAVLRPWLADRSHSDVPPGS